MNLLELDEVHAHYGAIHALQGVSLAVGDGEIVAIIGSNGAGKTTVLRCISGMMRITTGSIMLGSLRLDRLPAHEVIGHGVSISPEGRRILSRLTVLENLQLGAYRRNDHGEIGADIERMFDLFPRLRERRSQAGGTLSGGEQQMLAIARALMSQPRVLLLDEPTMGLAPILVEEIFGRLRELNAGGTTMLLVEQNAYMALKVADRAYILQAGCVVLSGTGQELERDETVRRVYLGEA